MLNQIIAQNLILIILILIIWLGVLSYIIYRVFLQFNQLAKGAEGENLQKVLNKLLEKTDLTKQELNEIKSQLNKLKGESQKHLQKVGLLRFNPFEDSGGDQSFVVSLLDEDDNGLVITSMHGRDKTRIYAKSISAGASEKYPLSEEEKQTIQIARKEN